MTTYTADDFKNARFATHPEGRIAARTGSHRFPDRPWGDCNGFIDDQGMVAEGWVPVQENPRPLTADDITDEMVERAWDFLTGVGETWSHHEVLALLRAALTEPPPRPEGAEGVETALLDADEAGVLASDQERIKRLADFLAERGVRVQS